MGLSADLRAAAVAFYTDYTAANPGVLLQIYPARPKSLYAPCAFIDRFREPEIANTLSNRTREPLLDTVVLHGLFDGADTVAQRDEFIDGYHDWVRARFHQAGGSRLITLDAMQDDPNWQPDWIMDPPFYYATLITFRGHALEGGLTI